MSSGDDSGWLFRIADYCFLVYKYPVLILVLYRFLLQTVT